MDMKNNQLKRLKKNELQSGSSSFEKFRQKPAAMEQEKTDGLSGADQQVLLSPTIQPEKSPEPVNPTSTDPTDKVKKIYATLESARGKSLLICIKGYPDPDNIGSSLALRWMAEQFDIKPTIIHFEEVSHHENKALVKKLDIDMIEYYDGFDLSKFDYYAVTDAQTPSLPYTLAEHTQLLIFVDHHKISGKVGGAFVDIREDAGSTSGIFAQYLKHSPVKFGGNSNAETKIATALMHGIRSDTDNFVNATLLDYEASAFLSKSVDKDLLHLISRQNVPAKTMDLTQIALQRKDIRGQFMFSGVGFVREEDRDGIGQCADYLLHREGIDTVIVYGVVGNEFVDGSLRTRSHTLDPDKWVKDVFGADKDGKYYGGGRKDKGGFQIPLGVFTKCKDKELLWILIKKTVDELFYEKIGIEANSNIDNDLNSN